MSAASWQRQCLDCGMLHQIEPCEISERDAGQYCEKCDSALMEQTDGSTLTVDIAHQRETVAVALEKFEASLNEAWQGHSRQLRLIVGGGLIRDAVLAELYFKRSRGTVLDFVEEGRNGGAVRVRIR